MAGFRTVHTVRPNLSSTNFGPNILIIMCTVHSNGSNKK